MTLDLKINLRPYQAYCKEEFIRLVKEGCKNICIAIKTGTGKTYTSAAIAQDYLKSGGIIIFIVPRLSLIAQTIKSYIDLGDVQIIQGANKFDENGNLYIASMQTIVRRNFGSTFLPALIIHDERHHAYAGKTSKKIMKKFPNAVYLSLTATPFDSKGWPLKGFDAIVEYKTTQWFIDNDYLVDCECYAPILPDLSKIGLTGGDYNEKELNAIMNNKVMIGNIVEETKDKVVGKKTLFFAVTISHAEEVAKKYKTVGFNAEAYHSKLSDEIREQMIIDFEDGKIDILVSVSALVMGFDVPNVDCLVVARPTKSQSFYRQLIGRGMRPSAEKTVCLLIDCAGVIKENGFPHEEVVPKVVRKKNKKEMVCDKCNQKAFPISKSMRKVKGVLNYVTTWSCKNNHTFETLKEAGGTLCPTCSKMIVPGGAKFREDDNEYTVFAQCECGQEIIIRLIPKIRGKLAKIEASRITILDLINKIGKSTKGSQRALVNKYIEYILGTIHTEMRQQCLSSLYVSVDMGLSDDEITESLKQATVDASLRTNHFSCLSVDLLKVAYNQAKDPANIIYMHNSRAKNPMKVGFLSKTINKLREFEDDFPSSKSWLLKAIKTRCKNINQRGQKMASLFYFFDMLRDKESRDKGDNYGF